MLLVRIALAMAGGLLVVAVVKSVVDREARPRPIAAPHKPPALPRHFNRLAAYYRVSIN